MSAFGENVLDVLTKECNDFILALIKCLFLLYITTYNGHPRDLRNWPLNTGGRAVQDH